MKYSEAPPKVKKVFNLMISYAVLVAVGTILYAIRTDFTDHRELLQGVVRVAGFVGLGVWLLSLKKQAWWFAVVSCAVLAFLGLAGIVGFSALAITQGLDVFRAILTLVLPTYLLMHAAILLMQRETRAHFVNS